MTCSSAVFLLACVVPLAAQTSSNQCAGNAAAADTSTTSSWNGWGGDISNSRFQSANGAQITAAQVPRLKLKWAYGLAGAKQVYGEPVVVGGRAYFSADTGLVYSVNAATGCTYWTFQAESGVRTAVSVKAGQPGLVIFGDQKANVYAVDAAKGTQIWKVRVDDHPTAKITGAPQVYQDRVYVPVASGEEGASSSPSYPCCSFRGSVVALDAATGKQIWKTFTIAEVPKVVGKNGNGTSRWAPAGAGVWNTPTIDPKRHALYIGTGDAYTTPAPNTTDAVMAMDLDSGKILWSVQGTENDAWVVGCMNARPLENCPKDFGPDQDFGSPPILRELSAGRTLLIAGQKSGNVWAYDPDKSGAVVWRTALVNNTKEFGGKIVWGGASDPQTAYFGLGTGGIGAIDIRNGERKWFTALVPAEGRSAHTGQEGPLTAIPGVVFSGGWDGVVRALSASDGQVIWQFDTLREFQTINGVAAKGGSMGAAGPVAAGGMLFVPSGYIGVRQGLPGNVVLAFSAE